MLRSCSDHAKMEGGNQDLQSKMADASSGLGIFGSFYASSVIKQLLLPDDQYKPPPLPPAAFPKFTGKVKFGADMKEKHFFLDKEWTFINHGAFGAVIKEALQAEKAWQTYCERQPLKFLYREFFPQLLNSVTRISKFIDATKTDIVFVQNVTVGNNAVVQSVLKTFKPGDSILTTSVAYGTVKKLLKQISKERSVRVDEVVIKFPIQSKDEIVKLIEDAIKPDTKFAVLDHVPSVQGLVLPIKEMVAVCHRRGMQVLVDGAHCLGSLPISMRDIGADYYVASAHKWFCSPKGCAVLYVDKAHHDIVKPLMVTWGQGLGFNAEFAWIGTVDYSPYLSMSTVLDFWEFYGPDEIRSYIYKTAQEAGQLLTKSWGTGYLADPSFFRMMVVVELPEGLVPKDALPPSVDGGKPKYEYKHSSMVQNFLYHNFKIEVPVKAINGKLYVRISVHVYNSLSDYQRLADAVNEIRLKHL